MAIIWNEVKRNETPDFLSTVESRLRLSGVLDALYLARVENMEFYYGPDKRDNGTTDAQDKGAEPFRSDV